MFFHGLFPHFSSFAAPGPSPGSLHQRGQRAEAAAATGAAERGRDVGGEGADPMVRIHLEVDDFLPGGMEHEFYDFPYIGNNHPN